MRKMGQITSAFCFTVSLMAVGESCKLHAQDQAKIDRLQQVEAFAKSLEQVTVNRHKPVVQLRNETREIRRESSLHFRLLVSVSQLANNDSDVVILIPVETTGLTYKLDTLRTPRSERRSGSDLNKVRIFIRNLFQTGESVAAIDVPDLQEESEFNAQRLIRDEVQGRLEWFLPDVTIDGEQKHFTRQFAVRNLSDEPVRVWCWFQDRVRETNGFQWRWLPEPPPQGEGAAATIPAGETEVVRFQKPHDKMRPIEGSRIRFHVIGTRSGRIRDEYRWQDLWLVEPNLELDGERAYYAAQNEVFTYTVPDNKLEQIWTQRLLRCKNSTSEKLVVSLQYQTQQPGLGWVWRKQEFEIPSGSTVIPEDPSQMPILASQATIQAESALRRFEPRQVWLIDRDQESHGYRSSQAGIFEYDFVPRDAQGPQSVTRMSSLEQTLTVRAIRADVRVDDQVIATVTRGAQFRILESSGGMHRIQLDDKRHGWLRDQEVDIKE